MNYVKKLHIFSGFTLNSIVLLLKLVIYCTSCSSGVPLKQSAGFNTLICVLFQKSKLCNRRILHLCYAVISDCLTHDTAVMYAFQSSLISYVKEIVQNSLKIITFLMGQHLITKIRNHKSEFT
jgi:hypothetical protein